MHGRTLAWTLLVVSAALVLPSLVLERHPAVWSWLAEFRPGTLAHAEGVLRSTPHREDEIVVIGSSVAVVNVLEEPLGEALGRPVLSAGILASPVCPTSMLAPEIAARRPDTVIVVISMRGFSGCTPHRRMAFDFDIAWNGVGPMELASDDRWLAAWIGDASTLVRHRSTVQLLEGDAAPGWLFHPRHGGRQPEVEMQRRVRVQAERIARVPVRAYRPAVRALARFVLRMKSVGADVVLVPAPAHPDLIEAVTGDAGTSWHRDHITAMARLARELEVQTVSTDTLGEYGAADFRDPGHLGPSGQIKFTRALIDAMR